MKRKNILPYSTIGNIIRENTGKRVSKEAQICACEILEDFSKRIIRKAKILAENSKRKTIKKNDIVLAKLQEEEK